MIVLGAGTASRSNDASIKVAFRAENMMLAMQPWAQLDVAIGTVYKPASLPEVISTGSYYLGTTTAGESWRSTAYKELRALQDLEYGWDGDGAIPPNRFAKTWAEYVLEEASDLNFRPSKVAPSVEGGVAVCFVTKDKYADIECVNEEQILVVISRRGTPSEVWEIGHDRSEISRALEQIRSFLLANG